MKTVYINIKYSKAYIEEQWFTSLSICQDSPNFLSVSCGNFATEAIGQSVKK